MCVFSHDDIQLQRLMKRDSSQEEDAKKRIASQMPQSEKVKKATVVIDNSGSQEETLRQLDGAIRQMTPSRFSTFLWLLGPISTVGWLATFGGWKLIERLTS
jgi:dephospho-CoA kinase